MNTMQHTITIGIDFDEVAKEVTAQLAVAVAGRQDDGQAVAGRQDDGQAAAPPFTGCRFGELAALKAKETCTALLGAIAGYATAFGTEGGVATIELVLPGTATAIVQQLIAARVGEAVAQRTAADLLASVPQFAVEHEQCLERYAKAMSALRQLLAPH